MKTLSKIILLVFLLPFVCCAITAQNTNDSAYRQAENYISHAYNEANIPGLSYVIIQNNETKYGNIGFSDKENKQPATSKTLYELGSTSKAFTALAVLNLNREGMIELDNKVSDYIDWFKGYYRNEEVDITIDQLLHHTSGIPFYTLSLIPESNQTDALERTIKKINSISLHSIPGKKYEYASVNYDILALVVEKITGTPFETYLDKVVFNQLGLKNTTIGEAVDSAYLSKGYKIGFFRPREYNAPTFKGNNASAYVVSNIEDVSKWLEYQMGIKSCGLDSMIELSHQRDNSVFPHNLSSYAFGWNVSLKGDNVIFHEGLNPNYSSFIAFQKDKKIGVAILTNSNSSHTRYVGENVLKLLIGEKVTSNVIENKQDKSFSVISIIIGIYLVFLLFFLLYIAYGVLKGKRSFEPFSLKKIGYALLTLLFIAPSLYGIYLLPKAMAGFTWEAAIVWTPMSFPVAIILGISSIVLSYLSYLVTLIFPEKNKYLRDAPKIVLLSVLSGLSNMVVILLITSSFNNSNMELKYMLFYFGLSMAVYLLGRKTIQTKMIHITRGIIYDIRMKLVNKVFSTSYEKFEKIDRGRVYSTMNDDIGTIGQSANTFVNITTSIITAGGAFIYMATLAFWATLVTVLLIGFISTIYYIVSRKTHVLFDDARETRTVYMRLLNGMIDGFKELSIHRNKKMEYKDDFEATTDEYRRKITTANVKFVNAFLIGESLLIVLLATVAFAVPHLIPDIQLHTVMSFIIILLYLIGPVNSILSSIPQLMQLRIAWGRVQGFIQDIPANINLTDFIKETVFEDKEVKSIKVKSLTYQYDGIDKKDGFSVGPIDIEVNKGEALFIIGGNGSGKTTLAKLITGLYSPLSGELFINDKKVKQHEIGEYFSAVFNPLHLFHKLYNIDTSILSENKELEDYLKILQLDEKVTIKNNEFSTIDLSGGQRKRLALFQCYLEDKPIYLFDEWAADQDPVYRKYFYRELLPAMKKQGKMVIAITHDDHYFDVADKVVKLDMGKVEYYKNSKEVEKGVFTQA